MIILGVDTGGTFTDFVCFDGSKFKVHKVLSTPSAPQQAILQGIDDLGLTGAVRAGELKVIHGTTVATNAALEGKGVATAYITNEGLKDVLRIGRQTRAELYNLTPKPTLRPLDQPAQLALNFEVSTRLDAQGELIRDFKPGELQALKKAVDEAKPEAIAINLLFSFLDPRQEQQLEDLFKQDYFVSRSSDILPEYKEYERGITTWINAWLGPLMQRYLRALRTEVAPSSLSIMQSSGLTISAQLAAEKAVNLLLSGPAGGLAAAQYMGEQLGISKIMTFDMGGTSTDVSLIEERFKLTSNAVVGPYPVAIPMADIHTIGAGGGSIAWIDQGGLLRVGPESAGAYPGPACYGQGGKKPTVTDANLILGHLGPDAKLAGDLNLDLKAAEAALTPLATALNVNLTEAAQGVIDLANEHMTQALRVISVQRGHDPRHFALMCFGGAGGLHLCDLAENLQMKQAIVPIHGGVLSALGMLVTKPGREQVLSCPALLSETNEQYLEAQFEKMLLEAKQALAAEKISDTTERYSLDLRYAGQSASLNIPFNLKDGEVSDAQIAFHKAHEQQFGHQMKRDVELVNCRLHIEAATEVLQLPAWQGDTGDNKASGASYLLNGQQTQIIERTNLAVNATITGPALILESHATTLLKAEWQLKVDKSGSLLLSKGC